MVGGEVRLVAIAGPPLVAPSDLRDACLAAAEGGVTAVQVRLKRAPASLLLHVTEALVAALPVPVYVNDRADVAWIARAHGVHVGTDDIAPAAIRRFAPRPFRIGLSVGTPAEAEAARAADVDYWSIGSVYATGTKADAGPPIGVQGFRDLAARAAPGTPVIAIGGIEPHNAAAVLAAGACGIAVSRAIFGGPDIARAARTLRDIVDESQ